MTNRLRHLIWIAPLLFCTVAIAPAQDTSKGHLPDGVTIRKHKWQQVGPGPSVDQSWKAESDTASVGASGDDASTATINARPLFVYSFELLNGGNKPIKAIRWQYLVVDSSTSNELGNHDFENFERVGSNKAKLLTARSRVSPSKTLPVQLTDKTAVTEKVVLRCVLYEDGTLWRHRDTSIPECEAMQRRAKERLGD
jgi:hypothetical protein